MGITEVITAPRSPWQNPYVERLIGSIRLELVIDTVVCLTLAKWETVSGQFGGYLNVRQSDIILKPVLV